MARPSPIEKRIRGWIKVYGLLFRLLWLTFTKWIDDLFFTKNRRSVEGKVVLITGASRGLGREMALEFAKLGAKVVLFSSKQANVDSVASEVRSRGGQALAIQCDVSKEEEVRLAARKVLSKTDHVDILVNNAAIPQNSDLLDTSPAEIRRLVDVNFLSHFWMLQQFLPSMIERRQGQVVSINSILGLTPARKASAYSSVKAGLVHLMESTESEILHTHPEAKIHFTSLFPGVFLSGMVTKTFNKLRLLFPIVHAQDVAMEAVDAILKLKTRADIPASAGFTIRLVRLLLCEEAQREAHDFINYNVEVSS